MKNENSGHARILIVDDNEGARDSLREILEDDYKVESAVNGHIALDKIYKETYDIILLDFTMPKMDGIETLKKIKIHNKNIDVIMVSATDRASEAASAIKSGAYDYITKPFDPEAILTAIQRVMQKRSLELEVRYLRSEVESKSEYNKIIGKSKNMKSVFTLIKKVSATTSNVLITGESGTGKELVARAIHDWGPRSKKPFVAINCAAIPSELIESELFGHEKGSFTGAYNRGIGKFEFAHGGTVFLDEISTLKLEPQAKLLRFLQDREFNRVGSHLSIKVDVRMVAATNISLKSMLKEERFREDLYFRLNVIPIEIPPLRDRKGDIPLLANYFLKKFNQQLNVKIEDITHEAMTILENYHWPGNIRELENLLERLVVLNSGNHRIDDKDLPFDLLFDDESFENGEKMETGLTAARRAFERRYILKALRNSGSNQTKAAQILKIHRNTLIQKIKALGINIRENV